MTRSRTKEFLKGTIFTLFLQIIITISGFITPKIMLTVYGSEINGIVSSLTQFINYFTIVEAGLGGSAIYALYKPLAQNDTKAVNGIVSAASRLYIHSGFFFLALIFLLAFVFPIFTNVSNLNFVDTFILAFIIGMTGILDFFSLSKYRVILTADQRVYIVSIASSIYYIVFTLIIFIVSHVGFSIVIVRGIALSAILLRSAILFLYCKVKYSWLDFSVEPNFTAIKSKKDVLYQQLCGVIQTGMPIMLATFVVNDLKLVSVFSIYNMVMSGINGILGIFSTSLASGFGNLIISNNKKLLRKTYSEFEVIYFILISTVYSASLLLIMPFIYLYTKNVSDISYILPTLGLLFVWNGITYNIKTPVSMLVVSAGMYKETRVQNSITAILMVVLGFVFAKIWGLEGIMIASIISNLYRTIDFSFFVPKHITGGTGRRSIFRMIRVFIIMFTSTLLFCTFNLNISTSEEWVIYAIIVTSATFVVSFIGIGAFDYNAIKDSISRIKTLYRRD